MAIVVIQYRFQRTIILLISLLLLVKSKTSAWLFPPPRVRNNAITSNHNRFRSTKSPFVATLRLDTSARRKISSSIQSSSLSPTDSDADTSSSNNDLSSMNNDCDEQGECEIDWDTMMPNFEETDEVTSDGSTSSNSLEEENSETEEQQETVPTESTTEMTLPISDEGQHLQYDDFEELCLHNSDVDPDDDDDDDDDNDDDDDDDYVQEKDEQNGKVVYNELLHEGQNNKIQQQQQANVANQLRNRFEMQWQMTEQTEECDVYKPISCGGKVCLPCNGQGICSCRFCHGTGYIYMKLPGNKEQQRTTATAATTAATTTAARTTTLNRKEQILRRHEELMFGGTLQSLLQTEPSSSFLACVVCQQKGHETCQQCRGSGWIADWTKPNVSVQP